MDIIDRGVITVGMAHMVPDQLSEVELLKHLGDFRWKQIGRVLKTKPHELVNDAGQRLYSSFINIECNFGPDGISQFGEGDTIHLAGKVRLYAKQFVEGWVFLSREEPPSEDMLQTVVTRDDCNATGLPWVYMTNALIARVAGNTRLKTFRPAGVAEMDIPECKEKPYGLAEHEQVLQTARIESSDECNVGLDRIDDSPIDYQIVPESDMNGAALLYFARYLAMMNYAERVSLLESLKYPFSTSLTQFLSTDSRKVYYYGNASASDKVRIYTEPTLVFNQDGRERLVASTRTHLCSLMFRHRMFRRQDGVLMAESLVKKSLIIPNRLKSLNAEARRFLALYR